MMEAVTVRCIASRRAQHRVLLVLVLGALVLPGCASVPPQVAQTHQKEEEILLSLRSSHLAMVDAYVEQKLANFEHFFFNEYGPPYVEHWKASFRTLNNRDYDEQRDFSQLYSDLVAEYQAEATPIEAIRADLKSAIAGEYANALMAHQAVGRWLVSFEKLNASERAAFDSLLAAIKPGMSLNAVDTAVAAATASVEERLAQFE